MASRANRLSRELNVVVTCTSRKRTPPPRRLLLRDVRPRADSAVGKWTERLDGAPEPAHAAEELYAGEHWSIVKQIAAHDGTLKVRVWVASAGYGLVPFSAPLKSYSATFDRGHPDAVPIAPDLWWRRLAGWSGPVGAPRTLKELAEVRPAAALLLVLSATYLEACRSDAVEAAHVLRRRGQFAVISSGTRASWVAEHVLPSDARLQAFVGGGRQALNARVAAHVVAASRNGFSVRDTRLRLEKLLREQPELRVFDRRRLSDEQIRRFIRGKLRHEHVACTRLLAELRQSGSACEQGRFRELYAEVCS